MKLGPIARIEQQEAELRKDKARLDWLDAHIEHMVLSDRPKTEELLTIEWSEMPGLRQAIGLRRAVDSAMRHGA